MENATRLKVRLFDHREFAATVVGRDEDTDVAVIKIDAAGLPAVAFGNSDSVRVGEWVLAIGNPLGEAFSFTVTADVILSSVPKEQAGAASAVSETAYELGAALGIAVLGSIVTGVYRGFTGPSGTPAEAHESLGGAVEAASHLPADIAGPMLDAARQSFVDGLTLAAGTGATVLLAAAAAAWFMLRDQRL